MPHTVYLIRHGESEVNVWDPPIVGGRSRWCELTDSGLAQARALGTWLADQPISPDRVVSSTAVRAQQTARYALEGAGIALRRLETFVALEEMDQGEWENRLRAEIYSPEMIARMQTEGWDFHAPGGESLAGLFARSSGWLEREVLGGDPGTTLVFCHGLLIKITLAGLFGFDRATAFRIPIVNTAISVIEHDGQRWHLRCQNTTPHLP